MSYTKTNWENLPSTATPVNANNLNKIENALVKNSAYDYNLLNSAVTNSTTTYQTFGNSITITTTGKPLAIFGTAVGYTTGGNLNLRAFIDGTLNTTNLATTSNPTRERMVGLYILNNVSAGQHTIQLCFACSQSNETATIVNYTNNTLVAFEI